MSKTKIRKDWYGRLKSKEELHDNSKSWLSEINFVNDELRFLNHLLGSNYIDFLEFGLENRIEKLVKSIKEEKKTGATLKKLIKGHERILAGLIKTDSVNSNANYMDVHKKLEFEMILYNKKYKKLKRQIFEIVENVLEKKAQKKLKHF
jgi:hypothetical protein